VIAVLDYGMGNLRSVQRALERVGGRPVVTSDPGEALGAGALVVPGVGAFGACMGNLRARALDAVVVEAVASERPVLGVCLGMQVLFESSEEGGVPGLGVLSGAVRRLPDEVKVPHMGWNEVLWTGDHPLVRAVPSGTRLYFVHSYAPDAEGEHVVGVAEHGRPFAAALARGPLFATQFHPEKSGEAGLALYEAFVKEAVPA
jgi:imidazole glycerol-phosphate synthase subunit HisH